MKKHCRSAWFLFLSLLLSLWLCPHSGAGAPDPVESLSPEFSGLFESFQGRAPRAEILRYSPAADIPVGYIALGVKPWLDLIDKTSYSLKLSLPLTCGPYFYRWHDEVDHFLGAGFLASLQLKSLPQRFGLWTLNTGFFYIRKDLDQVVYAVNSENGGGIGAINISIIY